MFLALARMVGATQVLGWDGDLDSWDPLMKGIVMKGVPLEAQTTIPKHKII